MERGPRITFAETEHDFGDVIEGESVQHAFEFKNTGGQDLHVLSARGS